MQLTILTMKEHSQKYPFSMSTEKKMKAMKMKEIKIMGRIDLS